MPARPKFEPGELVAVPQLGITKTEVVDRVYFDGMVGNGGNGFVTYYQGWAYKLAEMPSGEREKGAYVVEHALRKLPPDERLSWEELMSEFTDGERDGRHGRRFQRDEAGEQREARTEPGKQRTNS